MKFAAFFRNLNLGRPPAPSREQFEAVFIAAGAASAASFLVNGTMMFEASSRRSAAKVLKGAQAALQEANGFEEPAFLRSLDELDALVRSEPFAGIDKASVYEFCVTFLHPKFMLPDPVPTSNARGDVQVLACSSTELLSVSHKFGASPGSPNLFAEKTFGLPASTRAWNTVVRLVQRQAGGTALSEAKRAAAR